MARPKKITQEVTRDLFEPEEQSPVLEPKVEPKIVEQPKTKLQLEQEAGKAALSKKR